VGVVVVVVGMVVVGGVVDDVVVTNTSVALFVSPATRFVASPAPLLRAISLSPPRVPC